MKLLEEQLKSLVAQYGLSKVLRALDLTEVEPFITNYLTDAIEALEMEGK